MNYMLESLAEFFRALMHGMDEVWDVLSFCNYPVSDWVMRHCMQLDAIFTTSIVEA